MELGIVVLGYRALLIIVDRLLWKLAGSRMKRKR